MCEYLNSHIMNSSAHVAELVDAHGSGPCAFGCGGSSPSVGTSIYKLNLFRSSHPEIQSTIIFTCNLNTREQVRIFFDRS